MSRLQFAGRTFSATDLYLIREIARDSSNLRLTELSKTVCERFDWKRPAGKLNYERCRAFFQHLSPSSQSRPPAQ